MNRSLPILENARIASPCDKSWHAMTGDDRTRFCSACEKNVFNLVGLSDEEATALILEKEGRLCVRLYQRADGTLLTSDCPVGLRAARRKLARAVGVVAACFGVLLTATAFGMPGRLRATWRLCDINPFSRFANWLNPPTTILMGDICIPPPQNPAANNGSAGN
ncbi:MAG: hypothetical protein H6819_03550 [Phycisphaerales bacterium]|nr:hypothetical protein [Phycisphaerales bacterium]MCB9856272.1 hypothetical protein [Phycisphaerales bacterium]MCB9863289.1 hypothetical protein [Phycisphaerales bacterium]